MSTESRALGSLALDRLYEKAALCKAKMYLQD